MWVSGRARAAVAAVAGVVLLGGILAGAGGARAASVPRAAAATGYSVAGQLNGVAAISPGNAWAVGSVNDPSVSTTDSTTLLLHWNGKKWTPVTHPAPVPGTLTHVTATSANNAWAVGWDYTPKVHSYTLHWNGKAWSVQKNPPPVLYAAYDDVVASGSDAWIVGLTTGAAGVVPSNALAVHRTGGQWYFTPVPDSSQISLSGVAFSGKNTAWAVGCVCYGSSAESGIILRWTGTQWKVAGRLGDALPQKVVTGPGGQAWAVGSDPAGANGEQGYSTHWNGKTWRFVAVPNAIGSPLNAVAYFPGGTVWAVGSQANHDVPFIVRWTGKAWTQVKAPGGRQLLAVAGDSATDGWAVGGDGSLTTILHWNGKTWS